MNTSTKLQSTAVTNQFRPNPAGCVAERLTEDKRQETLDFLAQRPLHTVIMSGWIRDHGIVSPQHRGAFYGYRDAGKNLVGAALIGRNTLFEAHKDEAIIAFARSARLCPELRMVFAEEEKLSKFWYHYGGVGPMPRLSRHQSIKSTGCDTEAVDIVKDLRIANLDDLEQIVAAHAEMVFEETGTNPLMDDADGFRTRCSKRVKDGKVWVWIKDGELIFKTDIVSVTPEATYIEGLWVNPKERGKGNSTRCLTSMCQQLLTGSNAICGFLDEAHSFAHSLYRKAGFSGMGTFARIYV